MSGPLRAALEALREIAHGAPSAHAWGRAHQLLVRLSGDDLAVALDYASPALSRWPAPLRRLTAKQWRRVLHHGAPASWPLVASVELRDASDPDLEALSALPYNQGLVRVELHLSSGAARVEGAARLAASWLPAVVEELDLLQSQLGDEALEALLGRPWPRLTRLNLEANRLALVEGGALRPDALPALRRLTLSSNPLDPGSLAALAARGLPALEEIELMGLGVRGRWIYDLLPALLEAPALPRLCGVALPVEKELPADLQRAWARAQRRLPAWFSPSAEVQKVDIFQQFIDNGALREVKTLILSGWLLGEAQGELLRRLSAPGVLPALRCLELVDPSLEALALILAAPWASQLQALALPCRAGAPMGEAAAAMIAASASLGAVELLVLSGQEVGAGGAGALGEAEGLGRLRALDLGENLLGVPALSALARSPLAARLEILAVDVAAQGPGAAAALAGCAAARWRPAHFYSALGGWGDRFQGLSVPGISRMGWVHHGRLASLTVHEGELEELIAWLAVVQPEALEFGKSSWRAAAAPLLAGAAFLGLKALSAPGVDGAAIAALAAAPWAGELLTLALSGATLGEDGEAALLAWPVGRLQTLNLSRASDVTAAALQALAARFGERTRLVTDGVKPLEAR